MSSEPHPPTEEEQPRGVDLATGSDYLNRRRLETIQDAYERVIVRRNDAQDYEPPIRQQIFFEAVRDYLFATQSLFFRVEQGPDYWFGGEGDPIGVIKHPKAPEEQAIVISGLSHYLFAEPPFEFTWAIETNSNTRGKQIQTKEATLPMPERVSTKAYFFTNHFVQNVAGLDLDLENEMGTMDLRSRYE